MTSASELFYNRRSRVGRADLDLGLLSSPTSRSFLQNHNRRSHTHHHQHHNRQEQDGCDPLRHPPQIRHGCPRGSLSERTSIRFDQDISQFPSTNSVNIHNLSSTNRPRLSGNDRLPGAVLLARARLLERLRGVSVSGNRRSSRASSDVSRREHMFGDELRLVGVGDWGTETGSPARGPPSSDLTFQAERFPFSGESYQKKPPGLSSDAMDCLDVEIFNSLEKEVEREASRASWDCSICLESFMEGDELIRLPCGHRFHSACLDPWVRTCGDCPYCRRDIVVHT
ncbi:hypothetical protein HS088_TW17G00731 [Tripterygium wilfordii]|uniref:RING-type domain-containing protein n=1 Tax=Tripterygium wilfordii TaxID=458696 RepID=A0A7J7CGN2_TRIWF|nr:probable E3 ubiquitin-protein ligase RHY1A [Tripterygium wilfordii]KAF5733191.1 hypothetical protein HS088_TW17G00731 [Tripterygium wilfordii]